MDVDIDAVFKEIGEFGPYQKRIFFLLCLPVIFVGAGNLAQVFIAASPKYRCLVPQCDTNITHPSYNEPFLNFTIPYNTEDGSWDECHRYQHLNDLQSCSPEDFSQNATEECPEGKAFSQDIYISTIVTEFNLTCHDSWKAEMSQTIYFSGVLAGAFLFGIVADQIGRKSTLVIAIIWMAVSGTVTALVAGLATLNSTRFFNAMMTTGVFQTAFVLGLELVGASMRVPCGIIGEYFFALGEVLLSLLSWWQRDWRMIQLLISVPVSCFVFYAWLIPESPRWLQAQGKHQKAMAVLQKIARKNNKEIEPALERQCTTGEGVNNIVRSKITFLDVLRSPVLCLRMFSMFFVWIVTTLVYYGLSLNATSFGHGDEEIRPFVDFILSALVEIPGYTLAWLGMSFWGRKGSLMLSMILAGLLCVGAGFSQEYSSQYLLALTLLGKCCITCAFGIIYVFTSEMFPTSVRSTVLGLCSTCARIGAMLAPFSDQLVYVYSPLPLLVFGGLALVAGLLNLVMPETLKTELPDTIEEALSLGRCEALQVEVQTEEHEHLLSEEEA
ncbi:organic cation transporter protein-like isoform X1 [Eriocheir sinensis]|uniref:organic cation transporter protein-like isoform X1 n=1 Tax=Eriocheir sinensis TaxID=95602 RepID=UPI0021CA1645|nr:organic cation transporter protein-like isoform X1 [Eriocheir sinensis]XP_050718794.1 organic cation transporter protein-like isoform X1 [Eriocheir sinensis]